MPEEEPFFPKSVVPRLDREAASVSAVGDLGATRALLTEEASLPFQSVELNPPIRLKSIIEVELQVQFLLKHSSESWRRI